MQQIPASKVLVTGRSGVGKSLVVNRLFNRYLRLSREVDPERQKLDEVTWEGFQVKIVDGIGFEGTKYKEMIDGVKEKIARANSSVDTTNYFPAVLLVTTAQGARWEEGDLELCLAAAEMNVPIGIVVTNAYDEVRANEMEQGVRALLDAEERLRGTPIFKVNANPVKTERYSVPLFGIDELARGLDKLVAQGIQKFATMRRSRWGELMLEAERIINEEADKSAEWSGWTFMLPVAGKKAQTSVQRRMLKRLIAVFINGKPERAQGGSEITPEGIQDSVADFLIDKYRSGGLAATLVGSAFH